MNKNETKGVDLNAVTLFELGQTRGRAHLQLTLNSRAKIFHFYDDEANSLHCAIREHRGFK